MVIDRKFKIQAESVNSVKEYTEHNSFLFLARDPATPAAILAYIDACKELGCGDPQISAAKALYERVLLYQLKHGTQLAAVETGYESQRLLEPVDSTRALEEDIPEELKPQAPAEEPMLGLATSGQLLEEIRVRLEMNGLLDYATAGYPKQPPVDEGSIIDMGKESPPDNNK